MARGNQRENDRAKALKKADGQKKVKESGSSLAARQEADAAVMRLKAIKSAEKKLAEAAAVASGGTPVVGKGGR